MKEYLCFWFDNCFFTVGKINNGISRTIKRIYFDNGRSNYVRAGNRSPSFLM
jgi:hypothetical protein